MRFLFTWCIFLKYIYHPHEKPFEGTQLLIKYIFWDQKLVSYYQTHMKEEELVDYALKEGVFNKFGIAKGFYPFTFGS